MFRVERLNTVLSQKDEFFRCFLICHKTSVNWKILRLFAEFTITVSSEQRIRRIGPLRKSRQRLWRLSPLLVPGALISSFHWQPFSSPFRYWPFDIWLLPREELESYSAARLKPSIKISSLRTRVSIAVCRRRMPQEIIGQSHALH